jgi:hypothetical protein
LIARQSGLIEWWNFAGQLLNAAVAGYFQRLGWEASNDQFSVVVKGTTDIRAVQSAIEQVISDPSMAVNMPFLKKVLSELKFSACVPDDLLTRMLAARMDPSPAFTVLRTQGMPMVHSP